MTMSLARRDFVGRVLGGATAAALAPSATLDAAARWHLPLPAAASLEDEAFWKLVRDQFPIRPGFIYLNAANLAPAPYAVSDMVSDLTREIDREMSSVNRSKFNGLKEAGREQLAAYLGAHPDEIAITRNTSESNNTVVNGLTLGRGDEVVIWDQNHPTNSTAWDVRAQRFGFTVNRVRTPAAPTGAAELAAPFLAALSARTKVLAITHVSSTTGVALPARELCGAARERGVVTLLDGAQTFGSLAVNLHDIGCDFYTGSSHKWFMGPRETGVLYVRRELAAGHWPNIVGLGWDAAKDRGARKFESFGQRDDAAVSAVGRAVEFHNAIGRERVEERIRALAARFQTRLRERVPGVTFATPADPALSGGIVIFTRPGLDPRAASAALYEKGHITCATAAGNSLRFAPHVYVLMADVDQAVEAVAALG